MDDFPMEFSIGQHLDVIPKTAGGSSTAGYCDYVNTYSSSTDRVVLRSGAYANAYGGVACASAYHDYSDTGAGYGSRLAYQGPITEIEDVAEFKSL